MTDSKITPVTSSSVSAPSAGSTATPVTQRTGGLAEALLTAAPVKDAPPGAPWAAAVQQALAAANAPAAPGPSADDVAAASNMSEAQRREMVGGMVARLAERLKADGSDVEGWLRLLRAYVVLGERDKASAAIGDARRALANEPDKIRRIDEFAKDAGLNG